jgi:hypothetical protein
MPIVHVVTKLLGGALTNVISRSVCQRVAAAAAASHAVPSSAVLTSL